MKNNPTKNVVDYHDFCNPWTSKEVRKRLNIGDIYSNSAKCLLCNDIIRSKNKHDFVTCKCGNLSVDGGSFNIKRSLKSDCISFEEKTEYFKDVKIEE